MFSLLPSSPSSHPLSFPSWTSEPEAVEWTLDRFLAFKRPVAPAVDFARNVEVAPAVDATFSVDTKSGVDATSVVEAASVVAASVEAVRTMEAAQEVVQTTEDVLGALEAAQEHHLPAGQPYTCQLTQCQSPLLSSRSQSCPTVRQPGKGRHKQV